MRKAILRNARLPAFLAGGFVLLDVALDGLLGGSARLDWPHLIVGVAVLLVSYTLMSRAVDSRRRAEAVLRQAQDELEVRVHERTAELELANAALQTEIAERKRMEQALRQAKQRLELTQAAAGAGSWDWDIPSGRLEWSAKMYDLFGLDMRTTASSFDIWKSVLHPDDRGAAERQIDLALETHAELANEYRIIRPDGQIRWISALGKGIYDEQGQPSRMSGICLDITERKQVEDALRQSEQRFRLVLRNAPVTVAAQDKNLRFIWAYNQHTVQPSDVIGRTDADVFPPDTAARLTALKRRVLETGREVVDQMWVVSGDQQVYLHLYVEPIRDEAGETAGVGIATVELTERMRAEEALRASEEKFATVFHLSPDAIAIARVADGACLDVNEAFTAILGYSRSEVVGHAWRESGLVPSTDEGDRLAGIFRAMGQVADYELSLATRAGSKATMLLSLISIAVGGEPCILAIAHDITKRKRAEEALLRTQAELALDIQERTALEERQRLARELHDSVSQALYGVSLGVNTALALFDTERTKVLEALHYALSLAHDGLTEMRALIFELRPESLKMEGLVAALTKQAAAVRARYNIEVELSLCDEPEVPLPIKEALFRIAQEALQNAARHAHSDRLDVRLTREPEGLGLEVCDNGVGFDALAAYPGHLGLRSMRERAMKLGGTLDIASAPDCGTQVRVYVPIPTAQTAPSA